MDNLPKIFITRLIPECALKILQDDFYLAINREARPVTRAELAAGVGDAAALLCMLSDRIDEPLLAAAPRLKVVANLAVGLDNIDLEACTRRGITVTNTPGALTEATADLAFALILTVARRIVEGDRLVREGKFNGWDPLLLVGAELPGKTLGIIGMGRIGRAVARRAAGSA